VVLGYLGIGFAAGVVERAAGLSYAEVLLISTVLYAGSAQFVVTSMPVAREPAFGDRADRVLRQPAPPAAVGALAPHLRALRPWQNALLGLQLTDETFVVASARFSARPPAGRRMDGGAQHVGVDGVGGGEPRRGGALGLRGRHRACSASRCRACSRA